LWRKRLSEKESFQTGVEKATLKKCAGPGADHDDGEELGDDDAAD